MSVVFCSNVNCLPKTPKSSRHALNSSELNDDNSVAVSVAAASPKFCINEHVILGALTNY